MAVDAFIQHAGDLIEEIARLAQNGAPIETIARRFSELRALAWDLDEVTAVAVENDPRFEALAASSRAQYASHYGHLEAEACLAMVRGATGMQFVSNNDALALREVSATELTRDSHLAFVGCGSFPWSLIRYAELTGCRVTGIDYNPLAIHMASEALLREPNERARLLEADAGDVHYGPFTHVMVAAMATPKAEILHRVRATAQPGTQVVVRAARGLSKLFYEGVPDRLITDAVHVDGAQKGELSSWALTVR